MLPKAMLAIVLVMLCVGCFVGKNTVTHATLSLDCIAIRTIDRWRVLDPYHVIVYAPDRSAAYLVELERYCQRLAQGPNHINLASHEEGRLCAHGEDALLVDDQRCAISSILTYKTSD
jgi:hypothetical protein